MKFFERGMSSGYNIRVNRPSESNCFAKSAYVNSTKITKEEKICLANRKNGLAGCW